MRQDDDLDEPTGSDDLGTPLTGGHDVWTDVGELWRTDDPWQPEYPPPGDPDSPCYLVMIGVGLLVVVWLLIST